MSVRVSAIKKAVEHEHPRSDWTPLSSGAKATELWVCTEDPSERFVPHTYRGSAWKGKWHQQINVSPL